MCHVCRCWMSYEKDDLATIHNSHYPCASGSEAFGMQYLSKDVGSITLYMHAAVILQISWDLHVYTAKMR